MAPINYLVPNCAEKSLSGFSQQHELLNAVGLSLAFEPGDELVPHATLLITGRDGQRAQQRARTEALRAVATTSLRAAARPFGFGFACRGRCAARGVSRGLYGPDGHNGSPMAEHRGIVAVDRNVAESMECFPGNPRRIGHPVLVGAGVAARLFVLLDQASIGCRELRVIPAAPPLPPQAQ